MSIMKIIKALISLLETRKEKSKLFERRNYPKKRRNTKTRFPKRREKRRTKIKHYTVVQRARTLSNQTKMHSKELELALNKPPLKAIAQHYRKATLSHQFYEKYYLSFYVIKIFLSKLTRSSYMLLFLH